MKAGWWNEPEWSHPVKKKLESCGAMSGISFQARIYNPGVVTLGRGCRIDDFVHILGGEKTVIGNRVHIAPFVSIGGGGELEMGDYSGLSAGVRIATGTADHKGGYLTNACTPPEHRNPQRGKVIIGKHALIFTGAIILPGVEIGEGAVVGAGEVVRHNVAPWTIKARHRAIDKRLPSGTLMSVGPDFPRPRKGKDAILLREKQLIERYGF